MEDKLDIGIVTQYGIWFRGNLYSCSLAIHEKWFERARQIGGWPLTVKYNDSEDQIHVVLENGAAENCSRIEHLSRDSGKLMAYYLEIQKLMGLRKELLERKTNDEDRFSDKHLR